MTPTAINDIYASMLAKLDPLHQESFYFYLELMKIFGCNDLIKPTLAQITAARIGEDLLNMSYEAFLKACGQERRRIISRSVGLLQISGGRRRFKAVECFAIPQLIACDGSPLPDIDSAQDAAKLRRPMTRSALDAEAHVRASHEVVEWVHRPAYDFIFLPDGSVSPIFEHHFSHVDTSDRFLLGSLRLLAVSPSFMVARERDHEFLVSASELRLSDLIDITDIALRYESAIALDVAKKARLVVCNMHQEDFNCALPYAREELDSSLSAFPFWSECLFNHAWSLFEVLLPELLSEPAGNALLMPLWSTIAFLVRLADDLPTAIELVFITFLEKVEQHIWLVGDPSTRVVLYFCGEGGKGHNYRGLWHLSCTVPDFLGSRQPAAMQLFFRDFLSGNLDVLPEAVLAYVDRIAASIDLFSDIEINPPKAMDPIVPLQCSHQRMRLLLQCSRQLMRDIRSREVALDHIFKYCDEFRIVCLPVGSWIRDDRKERVVGQDGLERGERTKFIHLVPSSRTCLCLLQDIQRVKGGFGYGGFRPTDHAMRLRDRAMLQKWTQTLVEDIWEKAQGLDGTQQLLALACVKWTVPRWLGWRMDFGRTF